MPAYSFKRRFVNPIKVGLGVLPENIPNATYMPKRQTIRQTGRRRHAQTGQTVQLYCGMRSKSCFLIGVGTCVASLGITIHVNGGIIDVEGRERINESRGLDAFAQRDGFGDWYDMREFWRAEHGDTVRLGPFVGRIIEWQPIGDQHA